MLWFTKLYVSWACFKSQQEVLHLCESTAMVSNHLYCKLPIIGPWAHLFNKVHLGNCGLGPIFNCFHHSCFIPRFQLRIFLKPRGIYYNVLSHKVIVATTRRLMWHVFMQFDATTCHNWIQISLNSFNMRWRQCHTHIWPLVWHAPVSCRCDNSVNKPITWMTRLTASCSRHLFLRFSAIRVIDVIPMVSGCV